MNKKWWLVGLLVCLTLATLSPLASSAPDGLEMVAEDKGFAGQAEGAPFEVMADYVFPGVDNEALAAVMAGWLGTLALFGIAYGLARLIKSRKKVFL